MSKNTFYIRLPLLLALAVCAGIFIGAKMFGQENSKPDIDKLAFKMREIFNYIDKFYVDTVSTDRLAEDAIREMLQNLDPHSAYIAAQELQAANEGLEGNFEGIGVEFNIFHDTIYVVTPLTGGPSEAAGIKSGDKIVSVDGENVAGVKISNEGVFKRLKGKGGTKVKVGIVRKGVDKVLNFELKRDKIPIFTVDVSYMVKKEVGYIKINRFGAKTYDEFKEALDALLKKGMTKLILDLRDNPGGYMGTAIKIADEFLSGNKMIVYTQGKEKRFDEEALAEEKGDFEGGDLVVLINEGSASASEIVSGAVQDNDRALVVGRRSYGKGLVQKPISLTDGSEIRLTISRYYTPSGRSIQKYYEKGQVDEYAQEMTERYLHGEYFSEDSVKFDEKQKYKTLKGRSVYGGGGIMPDIFVARDTSFYSNYLNQLYGVNAIREYAMQYATENEKTLSKMSLDQFLQNFDITDTMFAQMNVLAQKSGVKNDPVGFAHSKKFIANQLKALIARNFWKNEGLYRVLEEQDEILQTALQNLPKAKQIVEGSFKK